ncbi:6-phosphogluconolactonase [Candidatus Woesearchaeota archaeon]|nr:6-phosphogluconolactonase [Candidatus Woesearchaeota archaeon]
MKMKLIKVNNENELSEKGADIIVSALKLLGEQKKFITIGLVGGRSVSRIYELLAKKELPEWTKVHFFLVDERNVPHEDKESNYHLLRKHLLNELINKGQITEENIHPVNTSLDANSAKNEYEKELNKYGGFFDIVILSSGEDNHVGAIFPNKNYPENEKFTYFNDSPKPPSERFTATPSLLSKTKLGIVIFSGLSKKDALKHFLNKQIEKSLPEKTLQKISELIILTDQ